VPRYLACHCSHCEKIIPLKPLSDDYQPTVKLYEAIELVCDGCAKQFWEPAYEFFLYETERAL
jgi:hypothetical protein